MKKLFLSKELPVYLSIFSSISLKNFPYLLDLILLLNQINFQAKLSKPILLGYACDFG